MNGLTNHNHVQLISNGSQTTPGTGANNGNGLVSGGNGGGSGRSTPNNDPAPNKLFVGGLSWQTTPEKLREYFGVFGTVTDVLIMKDPMTQVSHDPYLFDLSHLLEVQSNGGEYFCLD